MKSYYLFNRTVLFIFTIALFTGCNVTSSDDEDQNHEDPFGLILIENGVEIARQFSGEVTYNGAEDIHLHEGEESALIQIRFLNQDGEPFDPHEEDYFLGWEIEDESVLEIEQHEEDGAWRFHFVGVSAGHTHIEFMLMHGDADHGHSDFDSLPFEVDVVEAH